jgi:hypothetical protein
VSLKLADGSLGSRQSWDEQVVRTVGALVLDGVVRVVVGGDLCLRDGEVPVGVKLVLVVQDVGCIVVRVVLTRGS